MESRQLSRAQEPNLAADISGKLYFDRTFEFDAALEQRVKNLTVDEVNAAVRRYLDPERITVVKAGDFAGSEAPIGF